MAISKTLKTAIFLVAILVALNVQSLYATALIDAVMSHDYNKVEMVLKSGVSIDEQESDGSTAVIEATKFAVVPERMKILELLLQYNPNLDKRDLQGDTALTIAYYDHNLKAMDLLFSKMTIPPKSAFLSFEQHDLSGAVIKVFRRSVFMKIVSIVTPQLLELSFNQDAFFKQYFEAGKLTILASKFNVTNSDIPQLIVIIPQPLDSLGIKIPRSEKEEQSVDISSIEGKFGYKNLTLLKPDSITEIIGAAKAVNEEEFKKVLENFPLIIDTDSPQHPTRFYLIGHGNTRHIADIPINQFGGFLSRLPELDTEFIYINSCYAIVNLPQIQSSLANIVTQQIGEMAMLKKSRGIDFAIAIQATAESSTARSGDIKAMFTELDLFLQDPQWALKFGAGVEKPKITIHDVFSALGIRFAKSLPSIRLPGKAEFFRSINIGKMEIIDESKLIEKGIKRTIELIEESKNPNPTIAQEAKKKLKRPLEIEISIEPDVEFVQIFPMDLLDFTFVLRGMPKFISKLAGRGQHFIGKIIETAGSDIKKLLDSCFVDIFDSAIGYLSDRCWFIKFVNMPTAKTTIKKLAIHLYSIERIQYSQYAYIDEKGKFIISQDGKIESTSNEQTFESTVSQWFEKSIPSQETLTEATGGVEVTAEEKLRLEQIKEGREALKLKEPRFARTPQDLFRMFMAD